MSFRFWELAALYHATLVAVCVPLHSGFHRFPERTHKPGLLDMEVGLFQTAKGSVIKILRSQTPVRPHMVWYALYGTKGSVENGLGEGGVLYLKDEMGGEDKLDVPRYEW